MGTSMWFFLPCCPQHGGGEVTNPCGDSTDQARMQLEEEWATGLQEGKGHFGFLHTGEMAMFILAMRPLEIDRVTSGGCPSFGVPQASGFGTETMNSLGRCYRHPGLLGNPHFKWTDS